MTPVDRFSDPTVKRFLQRFGRLSAFDPGARKRTALIILASAAIGVYLILPALSGSVDASSTASGWLPSYPPLLMKVLLGMLAAGAFCFGRFAARLCASLLLLTYFAAWGDLKKTVVVLVFVLSALYVAVVLFRIISAIAGRLLSGEIKIQPEKLNALLPADLKTYTVLVPLFREPEVADVLVRALRNIDYPTDKLDIQLLQIGRASCRERV
mgnify:CR=1 FL=1